jgi:hypothetical protein
VSQDPSAHPKEVSVDTSRKSFVYSAHSAAPVGWQILECYEPSVVPAECIEYFTPETFNNFCTSAISAETDAVGVPIGMRQKSAVHFGGVARVDRSSWVVAAIMSQLNARSEINASEEQVSDASVKCVNSSFPLVQVGYGGACWCLEIWLSKHRNVVPLLTAKMCTGILVYTVSRIAQNNHASGLVAQNNHASGLAAHARSTDLGHINSTSRSISLKGLQSELVSFDQNSSTALLTCLTMPNA